MARPGRERTSLNPAPHNNVALRADLAFRYYRDLGIVREITEVARYMHATVETVEKWRISYNWDDRVDDNELHMSRLRYSALQLEQVVREELLKEINLIMSAFEQLLFTAFKKDVNDQFILKEGNYVLVDHLKIVNVTDFEKTIKVYKELVNLKLLAVNGIGTLDQGDVISEIVERRDANGWDVFRTMRECEIILGKIPDFLKQEAMILKAKEAKEHGDMTFVIGLTENEKSDPDRNITDVTSELVEDLPEVHTR